VLISEGDPTDPGTVQIAMTQLHCDHLLLDLQLL
jgi:hypothetical protein